MLVTGGALRAGTGDRVEFTGTVEERIPGGDRTANLTVTTVVVGDLRIVGRDRLPRPVVLGSRGRPVPTGAIISHDELPVDLRRETEARANRFDPRPTRWTSWSRSKGCGSWSRPRSRSRRCRPTTREAASCGCCPMAAVRSTRSAARPRAGSCSSRARRIGGARTRNGSRSSSTPRWWVAECRPWRSETRVGDVTGVLRYDFGNYEVAATAPLRVRPRARGHARSRLERRPGAVTVSTYNVLNLSAGPEDSLQRRLLGRQIAEALAGPEIIALQEIQDASGEQDDGVTDARPTIQGLIEAVRAAGGPAYRGFDVAPKNGRPGGAPGGNIRNAFLYDPASVKLVGFASLTSARLAEAGVQRPDAFRDSRDPLLAEFDLGDRRMVVINNHLTSRYGSTPAYGAVQPFVQAGEDERAGQTRALREYTADLLRRRPGLGVVVLGDMNTFEFTDDLARLLPGEPPVLLGLTARVPPRERYSYNFEGNSQTLDHVFVSGALSRDAEVEIVHLNTDRPSIPGRVASDHDPVVARLGR